MSDEKKTGPLTDEELEELRELLRLHPYVEYLVLMGLRRKSFRVLFDAVKNPILAFAAFIGGLLALKAGLISLWNDIPGGGGSP